MKRGYPKSPNVTISVNQQEIDAATRENSGHCMIADTIKKQIPTARSVAVDLQSIRWSDPHRGLRFTYLTPPIAQVALLRFDEGDQTLQPFSFNLKKAHITRMYVSGGKDRERVPAEATLAKRGGGQVPDRIGGRAPGRGALANDVPRTIGQRRAFGLRAMGRVLNQEGK